MNIIKLSENNTIKSTELVEIINHFREIESESTGKEYKELGHNDFMIKIKREIETLKNLGFSLRNFSQSNYINSRGKTYPCYELDRDGMLQMLNSESALVRYKTIEYINNLEQENKLLKSQLEYKAKLLMDIYNGGQDGVIASKQLTELEVKKAVEPLEKQIEEDSPFVKLAKERFAKGKKVSLTDATKSLGLKKGQITTYFKANGYLHKTKNEVNEKGKDLFKVYDDGFWKCIGILEEGIKFINEHLEDIKNSPCRFKKEADE